ncbi:MAG: MFS transporter, partial [Acidimicrobiales bacterium]
WFLIPRSRYLTARVRFDWLGLGLFVPGVCALLLAVSYGNTLGWGSPRIIGLFVVTVALGSGFLRRERRVAAPMLDLKLFSRVPFSAGIASGLLSYLVLFGVLFVVPYLLERADGASPSRAGLELMVMPLGLGLVAPVAGRLAAGLGARPLTVAGMLVTAVMLVLLSFTHAHLGFFLVELALLGAGLGAFTPPNNAAIMGSAPPKQSGMASGVLNMTRGFGTSLGLALTGLVFGVVAGKVTATTSPQLVTSGFDAAVYFLAGMAVLAGVLAALRGQVDLDLDPVSVAE